LYWWKGKLEVEERAYEVEVEVEVEVEWPNPWIQPLLLT
jgi:hypothetical protein